MKNDTLWWKCNVEKFNILTEDQKRQYLRYINKDKLSGLIELEFKVRNNKLKINTY